MKLVCQNILLGLAVLMAPLVHASDTLPASLDRGFRLLYNLDFSHAKDEFNAWERAHPEDPTGAVSQAAGLLFSELSRLGILESQFYADDSAFRARPKVSPDPAIHAQFDRELQRAEALAHARLADQPQNRDALFAMTLVSGLRADYAVLIEKRNLPALRYTRQSSSWAQRLLAVDPTSYDAYLATGITKYITGSMAAPVRWVLRLGGISANRKTGLADLQLAASRGHYLAPFARILLAIAYVREHDKPRARELLASLRQDFPDNPLFAREIARLDTAR